MELTKEYIKKVSKLKNEPEWMLNFRLKSFDKFKELDNPTFGPKIELDLNKIKISIFRHCFEILKQCFFIIKKT